MGFMNSLTPLQRLGIGVGICSFLAASTAQLDVLFGVPVEKMVVAALTITSGILGIVVSQLGGAINVARYADQSTMVKNVLSMPGVDHLSVNAQANQALAVLAIDPTQPKIDATSAAQSAVNKTASQAGNP